MDCEFDSLEELKLRIKPALSTKKREMNRSGYPFIEEEDIWNYLKDTKWVSARNLSLYQMVTDILNTENIKISQYLQRNFKRN